MQCPVCGENNIEYVISSQFRNPNIRLFEHVMFGRRQDDLATWAVKLCYHVCCQKILNNDVTFDPIALGC